LNVDKCEYRIIIMIAKSCCECAGEDYSLYRSQISYRDEFVFGEEGLSDPGTHIAVQYDTPNNPEHRLVPHKSRVCLKPN